MPTGYYDLYHVVWWQKAGSSHFEQISDYGFRFKEDLPELLDEVFNEDFPNEDYIAITKHRLYDSSEQTIPDTLQDNKTRGEK